MTKNTLVTMWCYSIGTVIDRIDLLREPIWCRKKYEVQEPFYLSRAPQKKIPSSVSV